MSGLVQRHRPLQRFGMHAAGKLLLLQLPHLQPCRMPVARCLWTWCVQIPCPGTELAGFVMHVVQCVLLQILLEDQDLPSGG